MNKLNFSTRIDATRQTVWETMLGAETYKEWAAPFCEGSYFEGSWEAGQRVRFLGPDGQGMSSVIAENRRYEFVSIKHVGFIKGGLEDTESEEVRKWAPAFENYTFTEVEGGTEVGVELEVEPAWEQFMVETWPRALEKLKGMCEGVR